MHLLRLPTALLLHCLSYVVGTVSDAVNLNNVCRLLQHHVRATPRLFKTILVTAFRQNTTKLAAVHPYWENIVFRGATSIGAFCGSVRVVKGLLSDNVLVELTGAPYLRVLKISPGRATPSGLLRVLNKLTRLEQLSVPFEMNHLLLRVIPPTLRSLKTRSLPLHFCANLSQLSNLTIGACPSSLELLAANCPNLQYLKIASHVSTELVLHCSGFFQLRKLVLLVHASYSLPMSLLELSTFDSNDLIGPSPPLTNLELFRREKPINQRHVDHLCSIATLRSVLLHGNVPGSTAQQLAGLPVLRELYLLEVRVCCDLIRFHRLKVLTINEYKKSMWLTDQVAHLTDLESLSICASDINLFDLQRILVQLPTLKSLHLIDCQHLNPAQLRNQLSPQLQVCIE